MQLTEPVTPSALEPLHDRHWCQHSCRHLPLEARGAARDLASVQLTEPATSPALELLHDRH